MVKVHAATFRFPLSALLSTPSQIITKLVNCSLHSNLHSALITWCTLGQVWQQVRDIIPRMPVQTGTQSLLIQEVCNQTDTAAKHEQTVEDTHAQVLLCLFCGE